MASVQRKIVHKQFNSPIALYSDTNIKATLDRELKSLGNGVVGWVIFYHHQFFYYSLRSKSPFLALSSSSSSVVYIFYWVCVNCCLYTHFSHCHSVYTLIRLILFSHHPRHSQHFSFNFSHSLDVTLQTFLLFFIEHWLKNSIDILLCVCACVRDVKWER